MHFNCLNVKKKTRLSFFFFSYSSKNKINSVYVEYEKPNASDILKMDDYLFLVFFSSRLLFLYFFFPSGEQQYKKKNGT